MPQKAEKGRRSSALRLERKFAWHVRSSIWIAHILLNDSNLDFNSCAKSRSPIRSYFLGWLGYADFSFIR